MEELFPAGGQGEATEITDKVDASIFASQLELLAAPFTGEEVYDAIYQMHPTKAPGPDGMSTIFFQTFRNVVGKDVIEKVLDILNNDDDIVSINQTHIVLIPKMKKICVSC